MTAGASAPEPIAIVGIGCRLPGGADDPRSLWRLLLDRFDAIDRIPSSRLDVDALFDPHPATPGRIMSEWGGFLSDIEDFDADFFGIAPREAERLDPQQRLLLETTWEALEDAGIPADRVAGAPTGVFVGLWLNDL
jgi:acyl transferase domain-containing protein